MSWETKRYADPEYAAEKRARNNTRRRERREAGLCSTCGRRPPAQRRAYCYPCLEKDAERKRQERIHCGGNPPVVSFHTGVEP